MQITVSYRYFRITQEQSDIEGFWVQIGINDIQADKPFSRNIEAMQNQYITYSQAIIEVKRISSSKFEVLSGIKEGDEVVNNSLFLIDSDVAINGED